MFRCPDDELEKKDKKKKRRIKAYLRGKTQASRNVQAGERGAKAGREEVKGSIREVRTPG
jgi:hypothetical protein